MRVPARTLAVLTALVAAACTQRVPPGTPAADQSVALQAEFTIPGDARTTLVPGARFGGISGVVPIADGAELLAISDDSDDSRMFRLRLERTSPSNLRVVPLESIRLKQAPGAPAKLDPEGIALTRDGNVLISSEGALGEEPRVPPGIIEFTRSGEFVRQLPLPRRFVPNERGPLATGVRPNAALESLSVTRDFRYLFTANELPLVQDDDGPVRIVRYALSGGDYQPEREFAYEISPFGQLSFEPSFIVNGVVELLALSSTELLALERGYAESEGRRQAVNRIRIYRVSLKGATDVSAIDSLGDRRRYTTARKTLVVDLNGMPGLSPSLRGLDNFEALAFIPGYGGGPRELLVVSDDNFSSRQLTAFLLLRAPGRWN